jgi:Transcriptional regulator, AbiEi antitoxin, Type IV TA system/Transcriptional regulator, AbiEi antitoxin N-terminal domain
MASLPYGVVVQSSWLNARGYSLDLQRRYRKSQWLKAIGPGAMVRYGDTVSYEGGIYALQQSRLHVHPGGRTALSLLGRAHYLELAPNKVFLFGGKDETLPAWFQKHDWGKDLDYHQTSFLPADIGLTVYELKNFSINISSAERAMMECLYLTPQKQDIMECYELMQGLNSLRPKSVQALLEQCRSVKVKRLFLYMAEKAKHDWLQYINLEKIDLGKGKRSILKNGVYSAKYQITIPKELHDDDSGTI